MIGIRPDASSLRRPKRRRYRSPPVISIWSEAQDKKSHLEREVPVSAVLLRSPAALASFRGKDRKRPILDTFRLSRAS